MSYAPAFPLSLGKEAVGEGREVTDPSRGSVARCPRDVAGGRKQSKPGEVAVSIEGFHVEHACSRVCRPSKSLYHG